MRIKKATLARAQALATDLALAEPTTPTAGLLEFYNEQCEVHGPGKPIKRFATRELAVERVLTLAQNVLAAAAAPAAVKREPNADRGAAVSATWANATVAKARALRHKVTVGSTEYRSVRAAFEALQLPLQPHGRIRAELVAKGSSEHAGHRFVRA